MENKSLLSLVNEFQELDAMLIESGGELTPELEQALQLNERNLSSKVDTYKLYTDHLESRADYFKKIEDQARQARKMFENVQASIKERMKYSMNTLGVNEIEGNTFRYKLVDMKPKLIINEQELSDEFKIQVITKQADKEKIQQTLDAGLHVVGVTIEQVKSLRTYIKK